MHWGEKNEQKALLHNSTEEQLHRIYFMSRDMLQLLRMLLDNLWEQQKYDIIHTPTKAFTLCQSCPPYPSSQHTRWTLLYTASTNNNQIIQINYQVSPCKKSNATTKLCESISNVHFSKKKECRPNHPSTPCIRINIPPILTAKTNGLVLEWKHVHIF